MNYVLNLKSYVLSLMSYVLYLLVLLNKSKPSMKRLLVVFCLLTSGVFAFGQMVKVQAAWNQMKPNYKEFGKAKENLDAASIHPKTSGKAKTWYYRGDCYYALYKSTDKRFTNLDPNPLRVAYISYVNAKYLDKRNAFPDLDYKVSLVGAEIFNKGSAEFDQKKFRESLASFETVLEIALLPFVNTVDTPAFFNAAIAAHQAGLYDKALGYYNKSIELKYQGSDVFHYLAEVYIAKGDTAMAIESYEKGIEAYPKSNGYLLIQLINYYIDQNDLLSAAKYVEPAVKIDKKNASLWNVYGTILEDIDEEKAISGYLKAIEIDSTFIEPYKSLGTLYYNHGVDTNAAADILPPDDQQGYKEAIAKRNEFFVKALPYYEKAIAINENMGDILIALKNIYYQLRMIDKWEKISKMIDERL